MLAPELAKQSAEGLVYITLSMLVDLAKPAASLTLDQSSHYAKQSGPHASRLKGRGMEFEEARVYQPGDDIRNIDWRVTARTDTPHTKIFREERERPTFISIDNRVAMRFATRGIFKSVQAAKLAGLIAWSAQIRGDRIGGQLFNDMTCRELKPQNGKHAVLRFLNLIIHNQIDPEPHNYPSTAHAPNTSNLEQVLSRLVRHTRPGNQIYILSDFRGMNRQAETYLAKMAQHCSVILIFIFDSLEAQLPENGRYRFTDTHKDLQIDTGDRKLWLQYQQNFSQRYHHLQQLAQKMGLRFISCSTTDDPLQRLRN